MILGTIDCCFDFISTRLILIIFWLGFTFSPVFAPLKNKIILVCMVRDIRDVSRSTFLCGLELLPIDISFVDCQAN